MIICFDLETTGLDKYNDKIIEVAMIKFDEKTFEIIDTFSSLVNPGVEIPDLISNITNIKNEDVIGAPSFDEIKKEIIDFVGDSVLLGHNVSFDIDFFVNNGIDIKDNIYIDTFFLSNILCFKEVSLNLEVLCNSFNIGFSGAHRALNDVKATIGLFEKLVENFSSLCEEKLNLLKYIFDKTEDKNISYLRDYLFTDNFSNISLDQFEKLLLNKIGKYKFEDKLIIDTEIDNIDMSKKFNSLGNVEKRQNQLDMTNIVMDSLNNGKKSVIEAPTGLGKSFAYLIPSLIHSLKTGQKVFISTKTKNLQDQLYSRDLFFLKENLKEKFSYTKIKGKKNYLSLKLFFNELWLDNISYNKVAFLAKISLWLLETKYGELDELNYFGQEFSFLRFINSDSHLVLSDTNDYKEYEFLFKARSKLDSSNLIIINHSLLFSDLNTENPIFGKIQNLVIDEGHNIEDSVTDSLRQKYNLNILRDNFELIENILSKNESKKIDFIKNKEILLTNLELFDDNAFSYLNTKVKSGDNYKITLIKNDFFEQGDYSNLLSKIELNFIDIIDILSVNKEYDFSKEVSYLEGILSIIKTILDSTLSNKFIKILSYNERFGLSFEHTLLNPGEYLKENLWDKLNSCILTSATLQIGGNFDYFKKLLSLDDFNFNNFESDFDYSKQATIFIPTDIGDIKYNSKEVVNFLGKFYLTVKGKVLTLLTSFSIIRQIYTSLNNELKNNGINLYAQGIAGSKAKLLSFYIDKPEKSILLGTDSFWEGVDIPGDDLKYLVIHKFPFSVPTDPIFQARSIFFKDPFKEYSIPKAIIKLKQGFGRLIRTKKDNGIVVLLDNRIYSTSWGKSFYDAFPKDVNIKKGTISQFISILESKD